MSCALALAVVGYSLQGDPPQMEITVRCHYCDDTVTPFFGAQTDVNVRFNVNSTPNQMKTAVTDRLIEVGLSDYNLTLLASDIVMLDMVRG